MRLRASGVGVTSVLAKRARNTREPIYGRVRELVDPVTGETVGALVPSTASDKAEMRARKFHVGDILRMELRKPRNPKFHRLVMKMCSLIVANSDVPHHNAALKILKLKTGLTEELIDGSTGKVFYLLGSIAFDNCEEGEFQKWSKEAARVMARDYFPTWTPAQVLEAAELMPDE